MKKYLVEGWYKKWSVWLTSLSILIVEAAPFVPEIKEVMPESHYKYLLYAILIARVIKQRTSESK